MKKSKFKTSEQRQKELANEKYQKELYARWGISDNTKISRSNKEYQMKTDYRDKDKHVPSISNTTQVLCSKKPSKTYTGHLVKGIATLHKSNAVPIIDEEYMKEVARMRR